MKANLSHSLIGLKSAYWRLIIIVLVCTFFQTTCSATRMNFILHLNIGIGQCVGAYNQKVDSFSITKERTYTNNFRFQFFLNFLQWATLWLYWTFATLLAMNIIKDSSPTASIDPEHIIIIAL